MTDTPRTSPGEVPKPKTFGELYTEIQSQAVLTPEQEAELRKRVLDKYWMLWLIQKRKETIGESTRSELDELLGDMPGKSDILARLDPLLPGLSRATQTSAEGIDRLSQGIKSANPQETLDKATKLWKDGLATAQDIVPEAIKTSLSWLPTSPEAAFNTLAQKWWEKAAWVVDAFATGDLKTAAKEASGLSDSISGAVRGFTDGIGNLFVKIGEFLSWLWSLFTGAWDAREKFDKVFGTEKTAKKAEEGADAAKKKAEELAEWAKKTAGEWKELIDEKMAKAKELYWKQLQKWWWIRDPADQRARFDKLWAEKKSAIQKWVEKADSLVLKWEKWNLMTDLFEPGTSEATGFLLRLVTDGIIPRDALFAAVGDLTKNSIKLWLKSAEAFITQTPKEVYTLIGEFSGADMSNLSEAEKSVLLASVHHNMGMMLTLAGKLSFAVGSLALMPLYWDQWSGIAKLKIMKNGAVWDFDAATKNLDEMLKMLWDVDPKSPTREAFVQMREVIRETQLRSSITATYLELQKAWKTWVEIAWSLDEIVEWIANPKHALHGISKDSLAKFSEFVSKVRLGWWEQTLITYLEEWAAHSSAMDTGRKLMQRFQSQVWYNPVQVRIADTIDQSKNVSKQLAEVVKNKHSLFKFWQQAKLAMKYEEFVACIDRWVLPIIARDHAQAKGILERFVRAVPPGLDHFFSALTVTLTIAHVSASDDKLKTLAQDFAMMNPFYWWYVLFTEWMSVENRTLTNPAYVVSAWALWAIGWYQASKIITAWSTVARMSAIADFTLGPVATFGRGVAALSRWVSYGSLFAGNILKPGALRSFARPGLAASALMIAAITYYMYGVYTEENEQKFLAEKWIIKPDGTFDTEKLKTAFMSLPEDKRSGLLEKLLSNTLEPYGVKPIVESGGASVVMHTDRTTGSIAPISLDVFSSVADTIKELWVWDAKTYLSKTATEATKKYIASLPIDAAKKQEFYAKFGITA